MSAIIECRGVWKRYGMPARGIKDLIVGKSKATESRFSRDWALRDINFEVARGSAFGIVGYNGTGKSTLLSLLLGTIQPDKGQIQVSGKIASLLELGAGFHPELTGRENIFLYGTILGMSVAQIRRNFNDIVAFSELEGAIDNQIRTYSSGMLARLGFSTIIHSHAEILLIDEVLAVGDSRFQRKCMKFLHDFKLRGGTLVIVSHDLGTLAEICDMGMCMDRGGILKIGSITSVLADYGIEVKAHVAPPALDDSLEPILDTVEQIMQPEPQVVYPQQVIVDTTNECNARCPFCPLFQGDAQMDRALRPATVMKQEMYEKIFSEISQWEQKPQWIIQNSNSESLQDPLVLQRLSTLKRYGFGPTTKILTNAHFLNEKIAAAILDANISGLMIGFDGATKAVYEAHRVGCEYDHVLNNIKQFSAMRDKAEFKTKIWIKYVRTSDNEHEVCAAYEMFNEFLDPALDCFEDSLAIDWGDAPAANSNLYLFHEAAEQRQFSYCSYFEPILTIQADGKVAACCWDYNLEISQGGFGIITENTLLDIWRGQKRSELRNAFATNSKDIPSKCASCNVPHESVSIPPHYLARISEDYLQARLPRGFLYTFFDHAAQ